VALWSCGREPVAVRAVRVEEEGEEEEVEEEAGAPRCGRLVDRDVAVETRVFGSVVVALADGFDLGHDARDVPGEGGEDRVSAVGVRHACCSKFVFCFFVLFFPSSGYLLPCTVHRIVRTYI